MSVVVVVPSGVVTVVSIYVLTSFFFVSQPAKGIAKTANTNRGSKRFMVEPLTNSDSLWARNRPPVARSRANYWDVGGTRLFLDDRKTTANRPAAPVEGQSLAIVSP